jgi:hypothetical protein
LIGETFMVADLNFASALSWARIVPFSLVGQSRERSSRFWSPLTVSAAPIGAFHKCNPKALHYNITFRR